MRISFFDRSLPENTSKLSGSYFYGRRTSGFNVAINDPQHLATPLHFVALAAHETDHFVQIQHTFKSMRAGNLQNAGIFPEYRCWLDDTGRIHGNPDKPRVINPSAFSSRNVLQAYRERPSEQYAYQFGHVCEASLAHFFGIPCLAGYYKPPNCDSLSEIANSVLGAGSVRTDAKTTVVQHRAGYG